MKKLVAAIILLLSSIPVFGQSVQQSGNVTNTHAPYWVARGVIGDGGTAADSPITTLGVTSDSQAGFCVASGRQTAAGRNQICIGAQSNGPGVISLQNYGTATAQNLEFIINGTVVTIPTGGSGFVQYTGALTSGDLPCWSGTGGVVVDCGYAIAAGAANKIPYWTSASSMSSMAAAASSVLVTSSGSVPSLSQTLPSAVQGNITSVGTITSGVWAGTPITVTGGGTGVATLAAHGVMIGEGASPVTTVTTSQIGQCLLSQGDGSDPIYASCASGTGTAGGSDTQVQFNNSTNLAGSGNLTWVTPALTIGQNATTTGQLKLASGVGTGNSVTIQNRSATSAYNFNLPTSAGTTGQPLISGGGSSTDMTFGTLGVSGGGTACSAASGNCLDNITNFSGTGYINRQGAGTYAFSATIPLSSGGTNANLTASNGGIFYSTGSAGAILSGTGTAGQILVSGSNAAPSWSTATFPTTCAINNLLYASSANVVACLATANSGALVTSAGGVPSISSTLPSAVQANITTVGTIGTGVWQGTVVGLTYGGTAAALTASTGGIVYSGASAMAILSGTATASLPMLSGSTAAPTWATISYPTSATSGGIPYFSSATAISSSGALGANQIVIGGGAGTTPTTFACATATTVVHGGTPPTCSQIVAADITTNTVTNANLAQMATVTLKGNPTNATANASDFTLAGLTSRGAPDAANDLLLLWDAASLTFKKVTPGAIASSATAGVSSIAGNTGAFTLANGIDNSTNQIQLTAARRTLPTTQTFLSAVTNQTYTTPANVLWIEVTLVGSGGGASGVGTSTQTDGGAGGDTCWKASGTACSSPLYSAGGGGGGNFNAATTGGAGGVVGGSSTCLVGISGGHGQPFVTGAVNGGVGGGTTRGGFGAGAQATGTTAAPAPPVNSGVGAGGSSSPVRAGDGAGGGATCSFIINSPAASYVLTVGAQGAAGSTGTSATTPVAGALGGVWVIEHYGT